MSVLASIIIPVLVLLVTVGQWHLQRMQQIHNEKSVRPFGQIVLGDRNKVISVYLWNNGLGPLIIDRFLFRKGGTVYASLDECLELDSKAYMHISAGDSAERVILPNASLTVFEKNFGDHADESHVDYVRKQLSPITLTVEFHDIYDNKMTIEREFRWFTRHMVKEGTDC